MSTPLARAAYRASGPPRGAPAIRAASTRGASAPRAPACLPTEVPRMRVLVTGGAGLIGSHLVDELLEHGYEVSILDNLDPVVHPRGRPAWVPRAARFVEGDVRDPAAVDRALEGCEGVFHQAVRGGFGPESSVMADVNCTGTARLFEAVARSGRVGRLVTASSMAVYGEGWYRCIEHGPFHALGRSVA